MMERVLIGVLLLQIISGMKQNQERESSSYSKLNLIYKFKIQAAGDGILLLLTTIFNHRLPEHVTQFKL